MRFVTELAQWREKTFLYRGNIVEAISSKTILLNLSKSRSGLGRGLGLEGLEDLLEGSLGLLAGLETEGGSALTERLKSLFFNSLMKVTSLVPSRRR